MFMRYRGGGVGHTSTRAATNFFCRNRHEHDTTVTKTRRESTYEEMKLDEEVDNEAADEEDLGYFGGDQDEDDESGESEEGGREKEKIQHQWKVKAAQKYFTSAHSYIEHEV
ncbi:hypothetical protein CPB83DRAFT_891903 [Crepidotus variabilis]|uniref:Uncharacterized protein n=1 Tax=Crepidotus variabilis TaxID=179855 RepID=A0A9P6JS44_9AGAR|nr:hypothetical protein CPB83DRAFT_900845 [Crepidotus variabilis]KAF9531557.1 hypothetical protein CPB83DRAFT_891903 [Crepidotus variabilis]